MVQLQVIHPLDPHPIPIFQYLHGAITGQPIKSPSGNILVISIPTWCNYRGANPERQINFSPFQYLHGAITGSRTLADHLPRYIFQYLHGAITGGIETLSTFGKAENFNTYMVQLQVVFTVGDNGAKYRFQYLHGAITGS